MKRLVILGSTGSIGTNTLDLVSRFPDRFRVVGLAARGNVQLMESQIRKFGPKRVSLSDPRSADELASRCRDLDVRVLSGESGQEQVAVHPEADLVISAIVGGAGLSPTLAAIRAGKPVALANKETLVMAGRIVCEAARKHDVPILPVDSEHNGLFQLLQKGETDRIRRIILTASGGPLLDLKPDEMASVPPERALRHPTWKMGAKISIDSATLMNKGLEVIEAHFLFGLPPEKIGVLIHRQSVVHSMVEYVDGSLMAQMAIADMRIPISYALNYPERTELELPALDLEKSGPLSFETPSLDQFPCLGYAYEALREGGTMPAVLNAANEAAVGAYLGGAIAFGDIAGTIRRTMEAHTVRREPSLEEILSADRWAREEASRQIGSPGGK
jgi:1-deoxy-D-xylulose-5-phosphate reductoisomerase